jgi:hypothetical protein
MSIQFNPDTHIYTDNGRPIPNVTTIISEITGHGWQASDWYLQRGRVIHKCAEFIAQGKEFTCDERVSGYVFALKRFFAECKPEVIENEKIVYSKLYQFAGTLDLVCKIGGVRYVIDFKHSIDKYRLPLQLAGYAVADADSDKYGISYGRGIEIKDDGRYIITEKIDLRIPRMEFLALRTAYRVRERCGTLSTQQKEGANV